MSAEKPYEYFDTPDGHDVFKKLRCFMGPTTEWAVGLGIADVALNSHPKGYLATLTRMAYIGSPIIGAGATFVLATNALASIRKKDDKLNWFLGGFAAGTVFGAWKRNGFLGFNVGMAFGIIACLKKYTVEMNYTILPDMTKGIQHHNVYIYDWSLTKERPGNWTTGK